MQVRELMTQPVIVVQPDATLEEAAQLMIEHRIGGLPVVSADGGLVGIVTESDFTGSERFVPFTVLRMPTVCGQWITPAGVEGILSQARGLRVRRIMRQPVITATEDEAVTALVVKMIERRVHRIPVVRDGQPVGMFTRHDVLRCVAKTEVPAAPVV
jgi:CBS domain-containing protein